MTWPMQSLTPDGRKLLTEEGKSMWKRGKNERFAESSSSKKGREEITFNMLTHDVQDLTKTFFGLNFKCYL